MNILVLERAQKILKNFLRLLELIISHHIEKSEKYIDPQYYSLLQVIADEYNGKFCQQDLFTGEF